MQCWFLEFDGICVSTVTILVILPVVIFFNARCVSYFVGWQFVMTEPALRSGLFLLFICDSRRILHTSFITFRI